MIRIFINIMRISQMNTVSFDLENDVISVIMKCLSDPVRGRGLLHGGSACPPSGSVRGFCTGYCTTRRHSEHRCQRRAGNKVLFTNYSSSSIIFISEEICPYDIGPKPCQTDLSCTIHLSHPSRSCDPTRSSLRSVDATGEVFGSVKIWIKSSSHLFTIRTTHWFLFGDQELKNINR